MGNFNRGGRSSGGGSFSAKGGPASGWERRGFNDRGSRGPAEMHQAVCDSCRQNCEVPFRPTSGKPVFCSSCFQNNRGSDSRGFSDKGGPASSWDSRNSGRSNNLDDRQLFDAVCDECGNGCKVPFQPSNGKPVYCSNCFGDKKGGNKNREQLQSQPQFHDQFELLNNKLDKILIMLAPNAFIQPVAEEVIEEAAEEAVDQQLEESIVNAKVKTKVAKKKSSKKKE